MGYFLQLQFIVTNKDHKVKFINECLKTAKMTESNVKPGELLQMEKDAIFMLDDKNNNSVVGWEFFNKFFDWEHGLKEFDKKELVNFQYLEFNIDEKPVYVCLCNGIDDTYCQIHIFPYVFEISFGITGWMDSKDGGFDQYVTILV